jgi:hypothetical protein
MGGRAAAGTNRLNRCRQSPPFQSRVRRIPEPQRPPPLPRKLARDSTPLSGENGAAVRRQVADGLYDAAGELAERGIDPLPLLDRLGTSVLLRRPKTDAVPLVTEDGSVR